MQHTAGKQCGDKNDSSSENLLYRLQKRIMTHPAVSVFLWKKELSSLVTATRDPPLCDITSLPNLVKAT